MGNPDSRYANYAIYAIGDEAFKLDMLDFVVRRLACKLDDIGRVVI